ncbi:MAG: hypothetical protein PHD48_11815, partial [Alphaproteobacteria bacterium]|nr:hypothetical protein [Alphaproteobacteria bacterium]
MIFGKNAKRETLYNEEAKFVHDDDFVAIADLKRAVDQLVHEDFTAVLAKGDPLSLALAPIIKVLDEKNRDRLKILIQIWVQQTQPILAIAEMLDDMRNLEQRNQAMATASEEMAASINEVAR